MAEEGKDPKGEPEEIIRAPEPTEGEKESPSEDQSSEASANEE